MARSGTVQLPVGDLGAVKPSRWYPVASVGDLAGADGGRVQAIARSVRVRVAKASWIDPIVQASLFAGVWWAPDETFSAWIGSNHPYCGALRFEYGYRGLMRTLYTDLRSGEYQIPPCEFLRVTATRYTPATDQGGEFPYTVDRTEFQVEGEIADGVAADFTPMVLTAPSSWLNTDPLEYAKVAAPPGAYAFEVYPDRSDADLEGNVFTTRNPSSTRDYVGGVWLPPSSPLPLLESYVEINNAGDPVLRNCKLVFFVR